MLGAWLGNRGRVVSAIAVNAFQSPRPIAMFCLASNVKKSFSSIPRKRSAACQREPLPLRAFAERRHQMSRHSAHRASYGIRARPCLASQAPSSPKYAADCGASLAESTGSIWSAAETEVAIA
jgi:hypothetical protein